MKSISIHFSDDCDTVEVLFRTIVSVNKLNIFGAVADLCEEFIPPLAITGTPVAMEKSESLVPPVDLLNIQRPLLTNEQAKRNLLQNHMERLETLPKDKQFVKLGTDARFVKTVAP